jgi:hypothetical protein
MGSPQNCPAPPTAKTMKQEKQLQALVSYILAAIVIPFGLIVLKRARAGQLRIVALSCSLVVISQVGWCLSSTFNVFFITKPNNYFLWSVLQDSSQAISYISLCLSESLFSLSYAQLSTKLASIVSG